MNKEADNDWFFLESNKTGTQWNGKCWYIHNFKKYEFNLEFEVSELPKSILKSITKVIQIPVTYPSASPELQLPELDGLTSKMYRGGKICLDVHFKPLWGKNAPHFGIAHALVLGVTEI